MIKFQAYSWNFVNNKLVVYGKTLNNEMVYYIIKDVVIPFYINLDDLTSAQRDVLRWQIRNQNVDVKVVKKAKFLHSLTIDEAGDVSRCQSSMLRVEATSPSEFYQLVNMVNFKTLSMKNELKMDVHFSKPLELFNTAINHVTHVFMENPRINPRSWFSTTCTNGGFVTLKYSIKSTKVPVLVLLPDDEQDVQAPMRICSFDFETHGLQGGIYQVGMQWETLYHANPNIRRVLINVGPCLDIKEPLTTVIVCLNEKGLLTKMIEQLRQHPCEILTGYNIFGFDLKVFRDRLLMYKMMPMAMKLHRDNFYNSSYNKLFREKMSGKGTGKVDIVDMLTRGMICVDVQPLIKKDYKLSDFKLNTVAMEFLGETKVDVTYDDMKKLVRSGTAEDFHTIGVYCIQDCNLPTRLLKKLGLLLFQSNFSKICRFPMNMIFSYGELVKVYSQIYVTGTGMGFVFPNLDPKKEDANDDDAGTKGYQGATVLEPVPGTYKAVSCLDFAALYPTIMISNNLCLSTHLETNTPFLEEALKKGTVVSFETDAEPNFFVDASVATGVIPSILEALLTQRYSVKKSMKMFSKDSFDYDLANSKQLALKISANSTYGVSGADFGALKFMPLSRTTTAIGRSMIDKTMNYCHEQGQRKYKGIRVIYGDSVPKSSLTTIRLHVEDGKTKSIVMTQEDLWDLIMAKRENKDSCWFPQDHQPIVSSSDSTKEYYEAHDLGIDVWTGQGFKPIKTIMRHVPRTRQMYRITTNGGIIEVTADHALVQRLPDGREFVTKPAMVRVGDRLVHKKFIF